MPSPPTQPPPPAELPPIKMDWLAAGLSFLIPGLGQVYQGRLGKGLLFFFGLYLLFFYGMWMGQWQNVWIPNETDLPPIVVLNQQLERFPKALAYRPQYLGQFWIGIASWPAIYQYMHHDKGKETGPVFGKFERMPTEDELNKLQRNNDKRWDLGWVYTVIAGVLNMLVIYDALAGPMFRDAPGAPKPIVEQANVVPATTAPPQPTPAVEPLPASPIHNAAPGTTGGPA